MSLKNYPDLMKKWKKLFRKMPKWSPERDAKARGILIVQVMRDSRR